MNEGTPTLLEAKTSMILKKKKDKQRRMHSGVCICVRAYMCVSMCFLVGLEGEGALWKYYQGFILVRLKSCYRSMTQQAPP